MRTTRLGLAVAIMLAVAAGDAAAEEATEAPKTKSVAVIAGIAVPNQGFEYGAGVGIRGGMRLGRVYLGGTVGVHQGDQKTITWGPIESLGIEGGPQTYTSVPMFVAADAGYGFRIPLAGRATTFTPYLSAGLLVTVMSSSGVYGDSTIARKDPVIGGGFSFDVPIGERYSLGLHYRMYSVGDATFAYGDFSEGTIEHEFSTSIFYGAFYSELSYRF